MSHQEPRSAKRRAPSFLPELRIRGSTYRTPSPPRADYEAFTPISEMPLKQDFPWPASSSAQGPILDHRQSSGQTYSVNGGHSNHASPYLQNANTMTPNMYNQHQSPMMHTSRGSQTPLDVFATLATSPAMSAASYYRPSPNSHFPVHPASHSPHAFNHERFDGEPPYKRARSHMDGYRLSGQAGHRLSGPGRHGSPTEASMEDAELLLGFVNAVAKPAYYAPLPPPPPPPPVQAPEPVQQEPVQQASKTADETIPIAPEAPPKQESIAEEPVLQEPTSVHNLKVEDNPPQLDLHIDPQLESNDIPQTQEQAGPEYQPPEYQPQLETMNERLAKLAALANNPIPEMSPNASDTKDGLQTSETKTRVYKGWPKGKPRGPRQVQYAKRGTKTKKAQSDGGTGQGSVSGSAGSPTLSNADLTMDNCEDESPLGDASQEQEMLVADRESNGNGLTLEDMLDPELLETAHVPASLAAAVPAVAAAPLQVGTTSTPEPRPRSRGTNSQTVAVPSDDLCAACQNARTSDLQDFWVSCNGCKSWFHHTCVGFKTEREVKDVDKFYCKTCEPRFGETTFVRKSARAHTSIDYAGLNEGKIRTSTDLPDHHYAKPIKERTLKIQPESFPRMPPELVTAQYFERVGTMAEPIVIPAWMNPRPPLPGTSATHIEGNSEGEITSAAVDHETPAGAVPELCKDFEYDYVPDVGQDKLDMVIPQGLTVRMVAELYGPEEKVEVIDVKNQEGEDKRWNMRQWADYYEATGQKPVRNVISLEVSQSKLGRLIRRPKIVRDLDLQDSVWPVEEQAKGVFPKVQFYCLMSVANCYTDFHIDFGGSSVYYHILHGQKTFFFIPPKKEHLKKYEEWCLSSEQNSIFLGDWTKECYRVDLQAGDTMLIPSGWIHAVWTPVDTLVIGGNFLTRMHYGMQIQINEIEKNTGVGRKFRYPHFQKVLWYTVIRYLERDPLPSTVAQTLLEHKQFARSSPVWHDFFAGEEPFTEDPELYNQRYYSQGEIEGLPDLIRYIFRTVMISLGKVQGVTKTTQEAVTRSLPKGYGDHLEIASTFAMWAAWKRGDEDLPAWAYPDAVIADVETGATDKKMSAAALKRIERQTGKGQSTNDRRQSARHASIFPVVKEASVQPEACRESTSASLPESSKENGSKRACDACRKRRMRCDHNEEAVTMSDLKKRFGVKTTHTLEQLRALGSKSSPAPSQIEVKASTPQPTFTSVAPMAPMMAPVAPMLSMQTQSIVTPAKLPETVRSPSSVDTTASMKKSRVKACEECRKTKRRCVHDPTGQIDPVKLMETPIPRDQKRKMEGEQPSTGSKKVKRTSDVSTSIIAPSPVPVAVDESIAPAFTERAAVAPPAEAESMPSAFDETATDVPPAADESMPSAFAEEGTAVPPVAVMMSLMDAPTKLQQDPLEPVTTHEKSTPPQALSFAISNEAAEALIAPTKTEQLLPEERLIAQASMEQLAPSASLAAQSTAESRTPSLNLQTNPTSTNTNTTSTESGTVSTSPPSSPLSDLNPSSPLLQPMVDSMDHLSTSVKKEPSPLRTPRQRKQVDRFSPAALDIKSSPSAHPPSATSNNDGFIKPANRKSSNPSRSVSREKIMGNIASPSTIKKERQGSVTSAMSPRSPEEEETLKLVRELSGKEFGLRRRKESSG